MKRSAIVTYKNCTDPLKSRRILTKQSNFKMDLTRMGRVGNLGDMSRGNLILMVGLVLDIVGLNKCLCKSVCLIKI